MNAFLILLFSDQLSCSFSQWSQSVWIDQNENSYKHIRINRTNSKQIKIRSINKSFRYQYNTLQTQGNARMLAIYAIKHLLWKATWLRTGKMSKTPNIVEHTQTIDTEWDWSWCRAHIWPTFEPQIHLKRIRRLFVCS